MWRLPAQMKEEKSPKVEGSTILLSLGHLRSCLFPQREYQPPPLEWRKLFWSDSSKAIASALYICCKRSFTTDNIRSFEEKKMSSNSGFCVETSSPDLMWNYLTCNMWTPPYWVISLTTTLALWQQWRYVQKTPRKDGANKWYFGNNYTQFEMYYTVWKTKCLL